MNNNKNNVLVILSKVEEDHLQIETGMNTSFISRKSIKLQCCHE